MHLGWVDHNGKPFGYDETTYKTWRDESARNNIDSLPDWVDWSEVVRVAEMMAVGKDTMRVDVFVGMSADDPAMRLKDANDPNTKAQQKQAVSTVVNELEFFSTLWVPEAISEEIARLWTLAMIWVSISTSQTVMSLQLLWRRVISQKKI